MTVSELIKHLQKLNGDVEIRIQELIWKDIFPFAKQYQIKYRNIDSDNPIDSNEGIYFIGTE